MHILKQEAGKTFVLPTVEVSLRKLGSVKGDIPQKIIKLLATSEMYPKEIAKKLAIHEQNIYYHIRKLEQAGIIAVSKRQNHHGTDAKYYSLTTDSFFVKFKDFKEGTSTVTQDSEFLHPFIEQGACNSLIIVGSPDPHGPHKARARDGYFGMDLALFLGTFLNSHTVPKIKLDIDVSEDDLKENNLIVIGGPIVNNVAAKLGTRGHVHYDKDQKGYYASLTQKIYSDEDIGIIAKMRSPFNAKKRVLHVAGVRNIGTQSAILAFMQHFHEIEKGNVHDSDVLYKIVRGIDTNSDGVVDSVEFLE